MKTSNKVEEYLKNICIYPDGTLHPQRRHNNCSGIWKYDGQVFVHQVTQIIKGVGK